MCSNLDLKSSLYRIFSLEHFTDIVFINGFISPKFVTTKCFNFYLTANFSETVMHLIIFLCYWGLSRQFHLSSDNYSFSWAETINNSTATNATTISVSHTPSSENTPPSLGADGNIREDGGSVDPNSQPTVGEESNNRLSGNRVDLHGQLTDGKKEKENKPTGEKLESNAQSSGGGRPMASHVRIVAVDEQPPFKEMQFNDEGI